MKKCQQTTRKEFRQAVQGNNIWNIFSDEKIIKGGDWVVDKIDDVSKSIGKAVQGAWDSVASFFNRGKYAYG